MAQPLCAWPARAAGSWPASWAVGARAGRPDPRSTPAYLPYTTGSAIRPACKQLVSAYLDIRDDTSAQKEQMDKRKNWISCRVAPKKDVDDAVSFTDIFWTAVSGMNKVREDFRYGNASHLKLILKKKDRNYKIQTSIKDYSHIDVDKFIIIRQKSI